MFRPFGSSSTTGSNIFGGAAPAQPAGSNIFGGGGIGGGLGGGVGGGLSTTSNTMGASGAFGMNPFGSSAGSLPAMGAISTSVGTGNPPYTSTSDQEGNMSITLYCISAMPAYRGKSLEELRLEDYSAGKKCATSFGGSATTVAPSSIFGAQPGSTSAFGSTGTGGMFGAQPAASGSVFGAAPKPTFGSPFGAPAATSTGGAFGSSAVSTGFGGTSAFGGSSTFGQPAQPAGQSIFGQPAPAATSAFSFGQQQQPAAPSAFGGFGQSAAQPATASPFGAPKPPTPFGGGAFGATSAAPASVGFGFGAQQQPAAAATATPFSFGGASTAPAAPAQPSAFGQQQPSGFSFGQQQPAAAQPSSGAFGFGASTTTPSTTTAFGQQQPSTGLSTGGGFSFGQQPQQQPAAQPSTSFFGMQQPAAPAATAGGMFGAKPAGSFSFGATTPSTTTPASAPMSFGFGQPSTTASAGTGFSLQQPTQTSNLPFIGQPDPSLLSLKPPLPSGLLTTTTTTPTTATPASATTPASTSLAAAAPSDATVPARVAASIAPRLSGFRPKPRTAEKPAEAAIFNVGSLVPRKVSIKKLAIPKSSLADDANIAESSGSHAAALDAAGEPAALKYGEYYMLPSEAVLKKMSYSQLAAVPNFVIGQKGVGRLRFLQPVDLTAVDLDMILDNIVVFDNHQVVIYPEDEYHQAERPPAGQGLNLPAECRLERCWPTARSSRDPITEMGSERMRRHIQRLQQVPGTQFIDYIPESGTWIFKVEHF